MFFTCFDPNSWGLAIAPGNVFLKKTGWLQKFHLYEIWVCKIAFIFLNKRFQVLISLCLKVAQNCSKEVPKSSARHRHNNRVFRGYHEKNENLYIKTCIYLSYVFKERHLPVIFEWRHTWLQITIYVGQIKSSLARRRTVALSNCVDRVPYESYCTRYVQDRTLFFFEEVIQDRTRSRIQDVLIWILHRCTFAS